MKCNNCNRERPSGQVTGAHLDEYEVCCFGEGDNEYHLKRQRMIYMIDHDRCNHPTYCVQKEPLKSISKYIRKNA